MWCSDRRRFLGRLAATAALPVVAGGCGFTPVYGEGAPARALHGRIEVEQIGDDLFGFTLRQALIDRLGAAEGAPAYRLAVEVAFKDDERAISDDRAASRFSLTGTASFRLVPAGGEAPVLAGTERAFATYSDIESPFASRSAQDDAMMRIARGLAERISLRIAATAGDWAG